MKKSSISYFLISIITIFSQFSWSYATHFPYLPFNPSYPVVLKHQSSTIPPFHNGFYPIYRPSPPLILQKPSSPAYISKNSLFQFPETRGITLKKSTQTPKKSSKKAIIIKTLCIVAALTLIGVGGYFYWQHLKKNQQPDPKPSVPVIPAFIYPVKPTNVITGKRTPQDQLKKSLSMNPSVLIINAKHAHEEYFKALEENEYLHNIKEVIIERTGTIKRVHAPKGEFQDFHHPGVKTQKEENKISQQDFERICTLPALQNVKRLTLKGFIFTRADNQLSQLKKFHQNIEATHNTTTLNRCFPYLDSLRLENCALDSKFSSVLQNHSLKNLEIVQPSALEVKDLSEILEANPSVPLSSLSLIGCNLQDETAYTMLHNAQFKEIKQLDLSNNGLSFDFLVNSPHNILKHFFKEEKKSLPLLNHLTLSNNPLAKINPSSVIIAQKVQKAPSGSLLYSLQKNKGSLDLGSLPSRSIPEGKSMAVVAACLKNSLGNRLTYTQSLN